jgi:hypothetical protein
MAFCPRCKKDVEFIDGGRFYKCTVCGFQFDLSQPVPEPVPLAAVVMTIGHVILRVVLIMGAVLVVGVAILFATCALRL